MERRQPKHDTARKTIFSFFRRAEKMVFPKNSCGYMIFLVLSEKIMFLFPENMIWHLRGKRKDDLSQKKYTEIWHFLQTFLKDGLFRKGCAGTWSFLYYLERWYIFPENMIFFPWAGSERWPFSRNTWKYDIFCVHERVLQTWRCFPRSIKIKDGVIPQKYT